MILDYNKLEQIWSYKSLDFIIQKIEDTKNIDLVEVSWCEIVVKSRIKIQTSRIEIQTQTKKPHISSKPVII